MSDSETPKSDSSGGEQPRRTGGRHRGRRGGRGRGRSARAQSAAPSEAVAAQEAAAAPLEPAGGATAVSAAVSDTIPEPPVEAAQPEPHEPPPLIERVAKLAERVTRQPGPQLSAISQAVDEVTQIIEALKRVLEQMEEVLELVELAERQKLGDEREIDSLRRALRQLQRPHEHPRKHADDRSSR